MVNNTALAITNFHDGIKESLSALKNLDIDVDSWDPVLIYHLTKKLDRQVLTAYEQSISNNQELQKSFKHFLISYINGF